MDNILAKVGHTFCQYARVAVSKADFEFSPLKKSFALL